MLEISRPDISGYELQDFGAARFIKLNPAKYLDLIGITPNKPQIAIINALQNPAYRFICAAISRRLGKTYIANIVAHLVALMPGASILIMSPNYSLSAISFELQVKFANTTGIEIVKNNIKDRILELSNEATIRLGSTLQADSVVGRSYDFIIFDEAALTKEGESAFNIQLRPTLDRPNSKVLFISTPRGRNNWFAQFFFRGFSSDYPSWASIRADYRENDRMILADIEEARKSMSDNYFRQEYEADFAVFEGQIFKFNTEECVQHIEHIDRRGMEMIAGVDVGYRDPTAFVVIGYDNVSGRYYAFDEYQNKEKVTSKHAIALKALMEKYDIEIIYVDAAAAQMRADWAAEYDITTAPAKKSVLDGITHVQNLIEHNRLIVDPKCVNLLATLDQYRWDENVNLIAQKPEHDDYSHMADALRYALYSHTVGGGVY